MSEVTFANNGGLRLKCILGWEAAGYGTRSSATLLFAKGLAMILGWLPVCMELCVKVLLV